MPAYGIRYVPDGGTCVHSIPNLSLTFPWGNISCYQDTRPQESGHRERGRPMAQATLLVRHEVEDYTAWRSAYESVDGLRKEHGCTDAEVLLDPADKQDVFVLHRFPTLEQARAFAGSSELREAMGRAGVKGAPRIEIAVEA